MGPQFTTGVHHMKQFAHNWNLPYCQCMEICSQAFSIQIYSIFSLFNNKMPQVSEIHSQEIYI